MDTYERRQRESILGDQLYSYHQVAATVVVPAYTAVSKIHRAVAGAPRGVISALNPVGYNDKQILTIRKLQINDEYSQMCKVDKEAEDDA